MAAISGPLRRRVTCWQGCALEPVAGSWVWDERRRTGRAQVGRPRGCVEL